MNQLRIQIVGAFCGASLAVACSTSPLPAPAALPTYRIDLEASEVTVRLKSGDNVDQATRDLDCKGERVCEKGECVVPR